MILLVQLFRQTFELVWNTIWKEQVQYIDKIEKEIQYV